MDFFGHEHRTQGGWQHHMLWLLSQLIRRQKNPHITNSISTTSTTMRTFSIDNYIKWNCRELLTKQTQCTHFLTAKVIISWTKENINKKKYGSHFLMKKSSLHNLKLVPYRQITCNLIRTLIYIFWSYFHTHGWVVNWQTSRTCRGSCCPDSSTLNFRVEGRVIKPAQRQVLSIQPWQCKKVA